jgi:HTH-type transcriptional regulator / antitoxin HigA
MTRKHFRNQKPEELLSIQKKLAGSGVNKHSTPLGGAKKMITSGAKYKLLIDRCALRPLASEEDLDTALEVSQELFERLNSLEEEEKDYLKVLGSLIETYESVHHKLDDEPEGTPAEMLRWLMDVNGLKQTDLCTLLGVTSGRASEIANGVRDMSKKQILILAEHFHVTPGMFLSKTPTPTPWRTRPDTKIRSPKKKPSRTVATDRGYATTKAAKRSSGSAAGKSGGGKIAAVRSAVRPSTTAKSVKATTLAASQGKRVPTKKRSKRA